MLYIGLLVSLFFDYVRPDAYLPIIGVLKINTIIPILVFVGVLSHISVNETKVIFKHPTTKWLIFFLFLLVVSVLTSDVTEYSYKTFKLVLGFLLWYYIIVKLVTDVTKVKGVFSVFVLSHVVLIILNPEVVTDPATRSYIKGNAFLGDGNDYALSASLTIPMCLFLIQDSKKFLLRAVYIVGLIIIILAIVGTQSRGASLALIGTFGYLWWMGRQKIPGLILIVVVLLAVISFAPPVYFERMNTIKNYESEGSAMGRIIAWKTAIRMVSTYPITGVGSGHFPVKLGTEFRPPEFGDQNLPWLTAHSSYFLILGELGVPGIVFFLALLLGNFKRNSKVIKSAMMHRESNEKADQYRKLFLMLNGSLVAFMIGGAFLSVAYYPHVYVLSGIFVAAEFMYKKSLEDTTEKI